MLADHLDRPIDPSTRSHPGGGPPPTIRRPSIGIWLRRHGSVAVALLPLVLAVVAAARTGWTPAGDQAVQVQRMREVGTRHTPLVGAYSRFGWDHPGPLLVWVSAPGLRAFGPSGVLATVALLNLGWLTGALLAARRLGGRCLTALTAAGAAVMIHRGGAPILVDPWNPRVAVLAVLCFLLAAAASAVRGWGWTLPMAVVAGSFAVQAHVGTGPVVAGGGVAALAWWAVAGRPGAPITRGHLLAVIALGLVLWSGPLVEQGRAGQGNLGDLAAFVLHPEEPRAPVGDGLAVAARELGLRPAWTGGGEVSILSTVLPAPVWSLAATGAVLAFAVLGSRLRHDARAAGLATYAAALVAVSVVAITRTTGGFLPYVVRWSWPVGVLVAVAVAHAGARALPRQGWGSSVRRSAHLAVGALAAVASLATATSVVRTDLRPAPQVSASVAALSREVRRTLPPGTYRFRWVDTQWFGGAPLALGLDLSSRGYNLEYAPRHRRMVQTLPVGEDTSLPQLVVVGGHLRHTWLRGPGARRVARYHPLTEAEQAAEARLVARVRQQLGTDRWPQAEAAPGRIVLIEQGADAADVRALGRLQVRGQPYDVWLVPPSAPTQN